MERKRIALELTNVHKRFGGIYALRGINLEVEEGEVHALIGENGAGKSTLVKIITGVYGLDEGEMYLFGKRVKIDSPIVARHEGIIAVYQESSLVENFTVAQNIFLGHEVQRNGSGWLMDKQMLKESKDLMKQLSLSIDPSQKVENIGLGDKRVVEILKALSINARIFIMDEPTAGMSKIEIENFFKIIQDLKERRKTIIYISHHLDEIFQIADRVTVLKDGENVGTYFTKDIQTSQLIHLMIGRDLESEFPQRMKAPKEKVLLEVKNFTSDKMLAPISFSLRSGEILGITGIVGSGKTELGKSLFGLGEHYLGNYFLYGREVHILSPQDAVRAGLAFIPEDRKNEGLFLQLPVIDNLLVIVIEQTVKIFLTSTKEKALLANEIVKDLLIQPQNVHMVVRNLSGGNQQKVVIGKWIKSQPKIIIMDEPTRGVDVGAKYEIYKLMLKFADEGLGIILLSSEFKEVVGLCDRILILRKGEIVSEMTSSQKNLEQLYKLALGG